MGCARLSRASHLKTGASFLSPEMSCVLGVSWRGGGHAGGYCCASSKEHDESKALCFFCSRLCPDFLTQKRNTHFSVKFATSASAHHTEARDGVTTVDLDYARDGCTREHGVKGGAAFGAFDTRRDDTRTPRSRLGHNNTRRRIFASSGLSGLSLSSVVSLVSR